MPTNRTRLVPRVPEAGVEVQALPLPVVWLQQTHAERHLKEYCNSKSEMMLVQFGGPQTCRERNKASFVSKLRTPTLVTLILPKLYAILLVKPTVDTIYQSQNPPVASRKNVGSTKHKTTFRCSFQRPFDSGIGVWIMHSETCARGLKTLSKSHHGGAWRTHIFLRVLHGLPRVIHGFATGLENRVFFEKPRFPKNATVIHGFSTVCHG